MPHIHELSSSPSSKRVDTSEERLQKIKIKNRRKLYLDRHPSYFTNPDLELTDPLLYDRCIRRFQSAAEREADGKARGYSRVLEADLYRSEAKLAAIRNTQPTQPSSSEAGKPLNSGGLSQPSDASRIEEQVKKIDSLIEDEDEAPKTKEEGLEKWQWEMTLRFLRGEDPDFEYEVVDQNEEWDDEVESREEEEKWFEDEEPEWVASSGDDDGVESVKRKKTSGTGGETGIQDF